MKKHTLENLDGYQELALNRAISRIAREMPNPIETLERQNSDSLDFHDISVWTLKEALEKAYIAGMNAAAGQPEEEPRHAPRPRVSPYERTKAAVAATGNKWAMENFKATHG